MEKRRKQLWTAWAVGMLLLCLCWEQKVSAMSNTSHVSGNYIYYVTQSSADTKPDCVYRKNLKTGKKQRLMKAPKISGKYGKIYTLGVYKEKVYVCTQKGIYRLNPDGTGAKIIVKSNKIGNPQPWSTMYLYFYKDTIYLNHSPSDGLWSNDIYSCSTNGKNITCSFPNCQLLDVKGGYLYYATIAENGEDEVNLYYQYNLKTKKKTLLRTMSSFYFIGVEKQTVYTRESGMVYQYDAKTKRKSKLMTLKSSGSTQVFDVKYHNESIYYTKVKNKTYTTYAYSIKTKKTKEICKSTSTFSLYFDCIGKRYLDFYNLEFRNLIYDIQEKKFIKAS